MNDLDYRIVGRCATAAEYQLLARSVGWEHHIDDSVVQQSLDGSLCGVVATHGQHVVGMARLVGDGAHYFYVQDMIVHPEHRDEGLGPQLLQALMDWIDELGVPDPFVGLFSSPEATEMYRDAGFTTADMVGMHN